MSDESIETKLARLEERQRSHSENDEEFHGRVLGELGTVGEKVDNLRDEFRELRTIAAPMIENYLAEHPSKVQMVPSLAKPPSVPPPYKIEAKRLGMVIGGVIVFLEGWSHVRTAIVAWLTHT